MSWGDPPFWKHYSKKANYHTIIIFIPKRSLIKAFHFGEGFHQNYLGIHHHKPPKSKKNKKKKTTVSSTSKWRKQHIQPSHHLKNPSQQPASKAIFRCNWEPGCRAGCWGPPVWRKNQVGSQEMNPWGYPNTTPNTGHHQDCHSVSFRYLFSKKNMAHDDMMYKLYQIMHFSVEVGARD